MSKVKLAVFASGNGSNLQALMDAARSRPGAPVEIALVVSDRRNARALERARNAGVDAVYISPKRAGGRAEFDAAAVRELEARGVQLIALAGFMRILGADFVRRYENRILNIHPSLLPAFPGTRAIQDAWEHGVKATGVTIHYVDEGVDTGPIAAQCPALIRPNDTIETLTAKIHAVEHALYPQVVFAAAEGRVRVHGRLVTIKPPAIQLPPVR